MIVQTRAEIIAYLGRGSDLSTAEAGLVNLLHPMAESAIKEWLQYDPEQGVQVEFHPGLSLTADRDAFVDVEGGRAIIGGITDSDNTLQLRKLPIRSIIEVREDFTGRFGQGPDAFPATSILSSLDYFLSFTEEGFSMDGLLHRVGRGWPSAAGSVKVTYLGGFTRAELDDRHSVIKEGVLMAMAKAFHEAKTQAGAIRLGASGGAPVTAEKVADYSVSFDAKSARDNYGLRVNVPPAVARKLRTYRNDGELF